MWSREKIVLEQAKSRQKKKKMKEEFLSMMRAAQRKKREKNENSVSSDDEGDEYFVWEKYLVDHHAQAVPKEAFKHVRNYKKSGFEPGMRVEAKDQTSSIDAYWVATVVMVSGPLLLLRFDGYDEDRSKDFWLDSSSELLQPIGWCARTNNILIPPEAIRYKNSNWARFLVENLRDAVAAPDRLFHRDSSEDNEINGHLKVGLNLELQDSNDQLCYWPAVIVEMYGLRLRLRFVGYEDENQDVWEYYYSDRVHNLGWCKAMGLMLQPPKAMEKYEQWKVYRECVKLCLLRNPSHQPTRKAEKIQKATGIKPGMKLETIHPNCPPLITVGTIKEILNDCFFTVEIDSVLLTNHNPIKFVCHAMSKFLYPVGWCDKNNVKIGPPRGFDPKGVLTFKWDDYLDKTKSKPAPDSLFEKNLIRHAETAFFKNGDIVEVVNQEEPSCYWIATVHTTAVTNFKHYELRWHGSNTDFSRYCYSDAVQPLGFGKKNGHRLKPLKAWKTWEDENNLLSSIFAAQDAADSLFMDKFDKKDKLPGIHGFKTGMQLEAVNPQDPSSICVASVVEASSDRYFRVQIDDFIEMNKDKKLRFWCHSGSKNIFPVGWCKKNNVQLIPPPGNPYKEFSWKEYMTSKKTLAAPESLFSEQTPSSSFEVGMKLEAVDQTNPQTISVATVTQIVGGTLWIRLDGYQSNAVEQIYDVHSCNLFPVGWSSMHGHPLLTPFIKRKEIEARNWSTLLRKRSTAADSSTTKRRKVDPKPTSISSKSTNTTQKIKTTPVSPVTTAMATPSSSTGDDGGARQEQCSPTTTIDLTDDFAPERDKELLLFVKKSCSCGPYLHKDKLSSLPDKIGPASPNTILKQIVEHVVLCAISRPKILDILSTETEKQSFLSILKTLTGKLEICENLFTLNRVYTCSHCDKDVTSSSAPKSPIKHTPPTLAKPSNTTNGLPTNSISKQTTTTAPTSKTTTTPLKSPSQCHRTVIYHDDDDDEVAGKIPNGHISTWSTNQVVKFVTPRGCKKFASVFQEQEVDGKALMLLSLDDIHKVLGVTLGPAIKLHDDVQKLRYVKQ